MKTNEKLGIWMDHSEAHLIEFSTEKKETRIIHCDHGSENGQSHHSEKQAFNKIRNHHAAYYKDIAAIACDYHEVLLFGPTEAKNEFSNFLRKNVRNDKMKIIVKNTGRMTDNKMHAYVREYFKPLVFRFL